MSKNVKTVLIGHPVSHSKSPLIHGYWLKKYGINGSYELFDLACGYFQSGFQRLKDENYHGINVTVPHKVCVMEFCDEVDDTAKAIGAVNTITNDNGRLYGTNTDVFGFLENIKEAAPGFDFKAGSALVLGAGGGARAVVYGLIQEGVPEIRLCNRTREKAEALARDMKSSAIKILDWDERNSKSAQQNLNLMVNTTSLGMGGHNSIDMHFEHLPSNVVVSDIVYTPLNTDFLVEAQKRRLKIVTGIGMLLQQARLGFQHWHGVLPEVTPELYKMVLK